MGDCSVAVLTPSLPERHRLLHQCKHSVQAQSHPVEHLWELDEHREGPQTLRNRLAARTDAEWLLPLDDDDVIDSTCVERLLESSHGADIVYPWCRMEGRDDHWQVNRLYNPDSLHKLNFIPVTALIRRSTFVMLGGYRQVPLEDWDLWRRAELHDVRFRCLPEVLWTYQHHEGQSYQRENV